MSVTGYCAENLPPGEHLDHVLKLVRLGEKFGAQHTGRKPDAITQYLAFLVSRPPTQTFAALLERLESESARHDLAAGVAVESVNRIFQVVRFHHPMRGAIEISFGTLRNKFTRARFTIAPKP